MIFTQTGIMLIQQIVCAQTMSIELAAMSPPGPGLPTPALQQIGSYLGYTGGDANIVRGSP
jgi:hypothetical protein